MTTGSTTSPHPTTAIGYPNCYHVHFQANGSLELYKITAAGAGAPVTIVSTPALTAGATAHIKIAATGLTMTRTDTGSAPITSTDTAYRGGYIQIACYSTPTA